MGMSGDYTIAIEEGSNMIRVGSAIFGAKKNRLWRFFRSKLSAYDQFFL